LGRPLEPRASRARGADRSVDEVSLTPAPLPIAVPKRRIVSVHAASNHAFAVERTGAVWAWGLNNYSQTGIADQAGEDDAGVPLPRRVAALRPHRMRALAGGSQFSIGLTADGKCLTWGRMDGSQIGVALADLPLDDAAAVKKDAMGKPRIMLRPAHVAGIPGEVACVAAGSDHSITVAKDGRAYAWGFNEGYRCAVGDDAVDDVVEPHRIENKLMRDKTIVWAGAGGQFSLVGIQPEGEGRAAASAADTASQETQSQAQAQSTQESDKGEAEKGEVKVTEEKEEVKVTEEKKEEEKEVEKKDVVVEKKDEDVEMTDAALETAAPADGVPAEETVEGKKEEAKEEEAKEEDKKQEEEKQEEEKQEEEKAQPAAESS
ncbi:hypothetical protein KEM52_003107, partial [Ascosphaera acerosa]